MTIIAYDGKTMAADRMSVNSDMASEICKIEVHKSLDSGREIIAWCGSQDSGLVVAQWYKHGGWSKDWPVCQRGDNWSRLVVFSEGKLLSYENEPFAIEHDVPFFAFGSGRDFAMGALAMGATAKQAVEVASKYCITCGLGVDVFEL